MPGIDDIVTVVWLGGIVVSLYPIYSAIVRSIARDQIGKGNRMSPGDVVIPAAIATAASLFWVLTIPFLVSFLLHRRHTFKAEEELAHHTELARQQQVIERMRTQAAIEVESSVGMNMVRVPSRYSPSGKSKIMHKAEATEKYGADNVRYFDPVPEDKARAESTIIETPSRAGIDEFIRAAKYR